MSGDQSSGIVTKDLIEVAARLLARRGLAAVTTAAVDDESGHGRGAVDQHYGSVDHLVVATATALASHVVIPNPSKEQQATSAGDTVSFMIDAHRRYVDDAPERHQAILQIASGAFGRRELNAPLMARRQRTLAAVRGHLAIAQRSGLTTVVTADLAPIAEAFLSTAGGIEMCHLLDRDESLRQNAYEVLRQSTIARLTQPREPLPDERAAECPNGGRTSRSGSPRANAQRRRKPRHAGCSARRSSPSRGRRRIRRRRGKRS